MHRPLEYQPSFHPESTAKPLFFSVLIQTIVVPVFTKNVLFPFASGIPDDAEAPSLSRFTVKGAELDPQVLLVLPSD
jgi:hypothetical protein